MTSKFSLPPAVLLFLRVMAAVFAAEALVMFALAWLLPPLGDWLGALMDSTLLTLVVTPLLWRWLVVSDRQRRRAEEELQRSTSRCNRPTPGSRKPSPARTNSSARRRPPPAPSPSSSPT